MALGYIRVSFPGGPVHTVCLPPPPPPQTPCGVPKVHVFGCDRLATGCTGGPHDVFALCRVGRCSTPPDSPPFHEIRHRARPSRCPRPLCASEAPPFAFLDRIRQRSRGAGPEAEECAEVYRRDPPI